MIRYVATRVLLTLPVLLGVSLLVFSMMHLVPGDPVALMMEETGASAEQVERLRAQLGLDKPLYVQYGRFLLRAVRGDLGRSIRSNRPVVEEVLEQFPQTVELTIVGMSIAIVVGMGLGVLSAQHRSGWINDTSMLVALLGVSMPNFWLGLLLIFLFALTLGWLPAVGEGGWQSLILPAFTLGLSAAAVIARMTRSSLLEVLGQDYIRTARGKGLREANVLIHHALRNALIPVLTLLGLQFGRLLAGAVVVETVFSRQGIGRLAVRGILAHDFPLVQGVVLLAASLYVLVNLAVDLSYGWIDPRIRESAPDARNG
ncbi:MAG: nickel ABC transporter permease [Armatimonadota bacterium]